MTALKDIVKTKHLVNKILLDLQEDFDETSKLIIGNYYYYYFIGIN